MTELTAEKVWDMVKEIYNRDTLYSATDGLFAVINETTGICRWFNLRSTRVEPREALALIVDACKRKMGEDWHGTMLVDVVDGKQYWAGHVYIKNIGILDYPGSTEYEAIIAAFLAWKDGK